MKFIEGGVTAPIGFLAGGVHAGIRKNKDKKDLALITSQVKAAAAAVYTKNLVKGAPLIVTKNNLSDGYAQAVICNSGNANTCNHNGIEIAEGMCQLVEEHFDISKNDVIVASTGVIGQTLDILPIKNAMPELKMSLGNYSANANDAIMTTDTVRKEVAVTFSLNGKTCTIGGIAKGSGMIHPNMATMLVFLTTDVAITPKLLQEAISLDVESTFNMVSVDGDTSTNDMLTILANGMANNKIINRKDENFKLFSNALNAVTTSLSKMIAKDGEGATRFIECNVIKAKNKKLAKLLAKSVITSSLVKAAIFGADANWGRILCALGNSNVVLDINKIDVAFISRKGRITVCKNGYGVDFSEEKAKEILSVDEIIIECNLNSGDFEAKAWGCDLTYDYVKINGDYRT